MHCLEVLVELNERAADQCDHCGVYRETTNAKHGLQTYEVFNAEVEREALLCLHCVIELVECGHSLKRVRP